MKSLRRLGENRAKAVLAVRTASSEAEGKLKVINGDG